MKPKLWLYIYLCLWTAFETICIWTRICGTLESTIFYRLFPGITALTISQLIVYGIYCNLNNDIIRSKTLMLPDHVRYVIAILISAMYISFLMIGIYLSPIGYVAFVLTTLLLSVMLGLYWHDVLTN